MRNEGVFRPETRYFETPASRIAIGRSPNALGMSKLRMKAGCGLSLLVRHQWPACDAAVDGSSVAYIGKEKSMMRTSFSLATCLATAALLLCCSTSFAQWGDLEGQFVLDGSIPELPPKVKKGDTSAKDAAVCAAKGIPDYTLKVNPDNHGIADIFVFFRKKPAKINSALLKGQDQEVVLDQKGCIFIPHAFILRTDQKLIVKSDDPIPHNTHGYAITNSGYNVTIGANDRTGTAIPQNKANARPEPLPYAVKCDIHPHMEAYCCVVDHPYATVTDKDGKFTIKGLPAGKHAIQVWHSRVGWVNKKLEIEIKDGKVTSLGAIKIAADRFKK